MHLKLTRLINNGRTTIGILFVDGKFQCFVLEDAYHDVKIPGKTRIPAGLYKLHLKPVGSSHMDPIYTKKFGLAHRGMIELIDVPNYAGVLIHIGNKDADTEGCLLTGYAASCVPIESWEFTVNQSELAYKDLYSTVSGVLLTGQPVDIEIEDRDRGRTEFIS